MTRVIAIAGAAGAGKGTAAATLQRLDPTMREWAFADPMKQFCGNVFGFSHDQLYGPSGMRNGIVAWPGREGFLRHVDDFAEQLALWTQRDYTECVAALWDWFLYLSKEDQLSPRHALQSLGTEYVRDRLSSDTWVRCVELRADALQKCSLVVVSDARFNNEFRAIRARGWELWHLERPGTSLDGATGQHVSEKDVQGPLLRTLRTHHYVNDGTLADLEQTVTRWYTASRES